MSDTCVKNQPIKACLEEQLCAFLANKPGMVANLCSGLTEYGVLIKAMAVLDTHDIGTVRMVVDDIDKAKKALDEAGAAYVIVPVVTIPIPNTKGGFAKLAHLLASRNINIEYFYSTAMPGTDYTLGVFRVEDYGAVLELDFDQ